jgi:hypothetical protein
MKYRSLKSNMYVSHLIKDVSNNADWLQFFLIFSRFEYALKKSGFFIYNQPRFSHVKSTRYLNNQRHLNNNNLGYIYADWKKFGITIEREFRDRASNTVISSIDYLVNNPPFVQYKNEHKEIDWRPFGNIKPGISGLIDIIKTVRNNLFHGAKYPIMRYNPTGDTLLIQNCIIVLKHMITINPRVKENFFVSLE